MNTDQKRSSTLINHRDRTDSSLKQPSTELRERSTESIASSRVTFDLPYQNIQVKQEDQAATKRSATVPFTQSKEVTERKSKFINAMAESGPIDGKAENDE